MSARGIIAKLGESRLFLFAESESHYVPLLAGTCYVVQSGLELTRTHLPLPLQRQVPEGLPLLARV